MTRRATPRVPPVLRTAAWPLTAVVLAVPSAVSAILVHQRWWGLLLGLAAAAATARWLPPGWARVLFGLVWCALVALGAFTRPAAGYLVPADGAGCTLVLGSGALLLTALATTPIRRRTGEDRGVRGEPT